MGWLAAGVAMENEQAAKTDPAAAPLAEKPAKGPPLPLHNIEGVGGRP